MEPNTDILEQIRSGGLALPPATITIVEAEPPLAPGRMADYIVDVEWEGQRCRFVAEAKKVGTPRMIQQASMQAKSMSSPPATYPMVIVPYLPTARLDELQADGVNGLDMCGNGVIVVPGKMLIFRTGQPNRFPQSAKLRNVYRGKNSVVARAFLIRREFAQIKEIVGLLAERGGGVVFSTVSKAVQRLEEELIVSREGGPIRVIQPDTLMDNLTANYEPPVVTARFRGKCGLPREEICRRMAAAAATKGGKLILTGAASAEKSSVFAREPIVSFYCTGTPAGLLADAEVDAKETDLFPNIELLQTADARVYFDAREENGVPFASPIQTWLELATGDKRQKDAADQVRRGILASLTGV